jgi:hypothetical protein
MLAKALILSLITLLAAGPGYAQASQPVKALKKGEPSPWDGFLFSLEKEQEVRLKIEYYKLIQVELELHKEQKELFRQELSLSKQTIEKEQQKSEAWRKLAESSTLELSKMQEARGSRDWLFVVSGVVLTVGAGWAIGQAAK